MRVTRAEGSAVQKPCVLLTGDSGSGKTHSVGVLCERGKRVLVADVEGRTEAIQRYRPVIVTVEGMDDVRELLKVVRDTAARRRLIKEATGGEWEDIDILAFDSLMEFERMLDSELRAKYPRKGGDGSYARWDEYGLKMVALCAALRDLTGKIDDPVSVIATLGEVEERDRLGHVKYERLVKGNFAPKRLAFYFSAVMRLKAVVDTSGEEPVARWVLETVGAGLKGPGTDVLAPVVDVTGDGFWDVWMKLEAHYGAEGESR